jgi:hypothetical protein
MERIRLLPSIRCLSQPDSDTVRSGIGLEKGR